jgi:uncharacterized protein (DUF433 family)
MEYAIQLSAKTYEQLQHRARAEAKTPDQIAEALLQSQLTSQHPHITIVERYGGPQPVIKGTRITVSDIVELIRLGETAETLVQTILPQLTLAQVYDALSYYYDHQAEIDAIRQKNTAEYSRTLLREKLDDAAYRRLTGQQT